jgi:hypothetical protein
LEHRRDVVAAAAYIAAMLFFIYAIADRSIGYGSDAVGIAAVAALALVHLATGFGGRWWLIVLPLAAVALAFPAGSPAKGYEPLPIWFGLAIFAVPGAALIAIGVVAARIVAARRGAARRQG